MMGDFTGWWKHSGLIKTSSSPGPSLPDPKRVKIEKRLAEAEYEMARLVMLKGLQAERLQLQKLQAAKTPKTLVPQLYVENIMAQL